MRTIILITFLLIPLISTADNFTPSASYEACFTPNQNCTAQIVNAIRNAKKIILVQAYSFTSRQIIKALINAKYHGVTVKILLDKSILMNNDQYYSPILYLQKNGIWPRIDYQPDIAHNKVIIIDNNTVITGSFNFTKAAQKYNAENVLIINDNGLAEKYTDNWYKRSAQSISLAAAQARIKQIN